MHHDGYAIVKISMHTIFITQNIFSRTYIDRAPWQHYSMLNNDIRVIHKIF